VGRGLAVLLAVAGFLACAPAWGSSAVASRGRALARFHTSTPAPLRQAPLAREGSFANAQRRALAKPVYFTLRGRRPSARLSITPARLTYLGGRVTFRISSSHATLCTLSSSPRFWTGPNPARVKCRGKTTVTLPAVALGLHWTFKFKARNAKGQAVATRKLVLKGPPFAISTNWSGYVVPSTSPVTQVSGRFTVPKLNCSHTRNAGVSSWVGIGGAGGSSGDLLQTGVRSMCIGGRQKENVGWWEEFPENAETDFATMSVSPGDSIQASVSQNPDRSWTTRVDDLTKGVSGVMTTGDVYGTQLDSSPGMWLQQEGSAAALSYAGGFTAEWIAEQFGTAGGSVVPLADFGKVAFTGLATSLPSWALTGSEQVGIGDRNGLLWAAPSAPDASGRGFSIRYTG
jgi:peptidase A4-like protein